jgi:hypothetical protein
VLVLACGAWAQGDDKIMQPQNVYCLVRSGGCLLAGTNNDTRLVKKISADTLLGCQNACSDYSNDGVKCTGVEWNTAIQPKVDDEKWNVKNRNCGLQGRGAIVDSEGDDQSNGDLDLLCYSKEDAPCSVAEPT